MTLCIIWNSGDNIHFASDSRGMIAANPIDAVIKVLRIPYRVSGASIAGAPPPILAQGEIGMVAAGATLIALMTKEAVVELVRNMQGVQGHNTFGLDEIAAFMFRGFAEMCARFRVMGPSGDTSVVMAGLCAATNRLRAFKMEYVSSIGDPIMSEVLQNPMDVEYLGTPAGVVAARNAIRARPVTASIALNALKTAIDDPAIPGVGGNLQYGSFDNAEFVVSGVAVLSPDGVHYWRGPLDLNGTAFDQPGSLLPSFPYLDLI